MQRILRQSDLALPFSFIANQGLGKTNHTFQSDVLSSGSRLFGRAELNCAINVTNGNMFFRDRVMGSEELGHAIVFSYVHNSLEVNPVLRWRFSFGRQIKTVTEKEMIVIVEADGHEVTYFYDHVNNTYQAGECSDGKPFIKFDGEANEWIWFHPDSRQANTFNIHGDLIKQTDAAGNDTHYEYEGVHCLKKIIAPTKVSYEIKRVNNQVEIYFNKDTPALLHTYTFDDSQQLIKSETPDHDEIHYQYSSSGQLSYVTQSDESTLTFKYFSDNKLNSVQVGDDVSNAHTLTYQDNKTVVTDPSRSELSFELSDVHTPLACYLDKQLVHDYQHNALGQLMRVSHPDKSAETYQYDDRSAMLMSHTHRDGTRTTYDYSDNTLHPVLRKKSHFAHSELISTTYYVYDDAFKGSHALLRYEVSSSGRVTEYLSDTVTGLVIGKRLFLNNTFILNVDSEPTLEALQAWVNQLKESGSLSNTVLTRYDYDARGRKKCIHQYAMVNLDGIGVESDHDAEELYEYDDAGRVTKHAVKVSATEYHHTVYTYDDLGNRISEVVSEGSPLAQATMVEFDGKTVKKHLPNGRVEMVASDTRGMLQTMSATVQKNDRLEERKESHFYDELNRFSIVNLPDGGHVSQYYDAFHRPISTVTQSGRVKTTEYNDQCRYQITREYARTVDASQVLHLESQLQANRDDMNDRQSYAFFGLRDEPRYRIDPEGYVTEYQYNSFGKMIHQIKYNNKITPDELQNLLAGREIHRMPDRTSATIQSVFYNADGYKIAEQDEAGFVTQYDRDAFGRLLHEVTYINKNTAYVFEFAMLCPTVDPERDLHHYYFYNLLNQCVMEVDAEGYVTAHTYYQDGLKQTSTRYANKVDAAWYQDTRLSPAPVLSSEDIAVHHEYDEARRLRGTHHTTGKSTQYVYDEMSHVTKKYTYDQLTPNSVSADARRGTENYYDAWGQLTHHVNPFVSQKITELTFSERLSETDKPSAIDDIIKTHAERFEYNACGLKTASVDPLGNRTIYFYDRDNRLVMSVNPLGAVTENSFNTFGDIIATCQCYQLLPKAEFFGLVGGYVTRELQQLIQHDAKDVITQYQYNKRGQIIKKTDPEGFESTFDYNAFGACTEERKSSLCIQHDYDARGLRIKTTKQTKGGIAVSDKKAYDHPLRKLTDEFDGVGGHAHHEYDKLGNKIETTQKISDSHYVTVEKSVFNAFSDLVKKTNADHETIEIKYDRNKRSKTVSMVGSSEVTATKENIFGESIAVSDVSEENQTTQLLTHAPDGSVQTELNALGESRQINHDLLGRVDSEKSVLGVETMYERNAAGHVTKKTIASSDSKLQIKTTFEPNAFGQHETIVNPKGVVIKNQHDRCGRVIHTVKDAGELGRHITDTFLHNEFGSEADVISGDEVQTDQYHLKKEYDGLNRLVGATVDPGGLDIRTAHEYDSASRLIKETNPNGFATRYFYDLLGRKSFEVFQYTKDQVGAIEYTYTDSGKLKSKRTYHNAVDQTFLTEQTTLTDLHTLFKSNVNDTVTVFYYNAAGREQYQLNFIFDTEKNLLEASVKETIYDDAGREAVTTLFSNLINVTFSMPETTESLAVLLAENSAPQKKRALNRWYDSASRERLLINQDGTVVENQYNASGQLIAHIQYAQPIREEVNPLIEDLTSALLRVPRSPAQDRRSHFVYDGFGRLNYSVTPEGYVTFKDYDESGNVIQLVTFAQPITVSNDYQEIVSMVVALKPDCTKDKITITQYDALDRVTSISDGNGLTEQFKRDALGNLRVHVDKENRESKKEYDRAKRLVKETSPVTTITQVIRDADGKLIYQDHQTAVITKTDFDNAGNTIAITEGFGLPEARTVKMAYTPQNKLCETTVENVLVNDAGGVQPDLSVLPLKSVSLTTKIITNTKGKKVAEMNAAGVYSYYVYNSAEQLVFKIKHNHAVIQYSYDAFGQVVSERQFATPISIDHTTFSHAVLTPEKMHEIVQPSEDDRLTAYEYDNVGHVTRVQTGAVFYYSDGHYGVAQPETIKHYNLFGECTYEATLVSEGKWAEKFIYFNREGYIVATLDENKHLVCYERGVDGRELARIEFANALDLSLSKEEDSFAIKLDHLLSTLKKSHKDRQYLSTYDALGQKCSESILVRKEETEIFIHPSSHQLVLGEEHAPPAVRQQDVSCMKRFQYTASGKLKSFTYEDGSVVYKYYDDRDRLIGETEVPRTDVHGKGSVVVPLNRYKHNAFGQVVVTEQSSLGCQFNEPDVLPALLGSEAEISSGVVLIDNRGLPQIKQDAEKNQTAFTYTPTRKIARELQPVKCWQKLQDPVTFELTQHVDEKKFTYDTSDRTTVVEHCRDGVSEQKTVNTYNTFGNFLSEGSSDGDLPSKRKVDSRGLAWFSNSSDGANTICLSDLRGLETARIQSGEIDLDTFTYDTLPSVLAIEPEKLSRTENSYNAGGQVVAMRSPIWFKDPTQAPTRQYGYDHWNKTQETDSQGNVTDDEFNHHNQLIQHTQPLVDVMCNDRVVRQLRPVTQHFYTVRGFQIAVTDANQHTEAYVLDEAGQWITHILADGTLIERRALDAYGQIIASFDARGKKWTYGYDKIGQLTLSLFPSGRKITRTYDGKRGLSSEMNASLDVTRYNADSRGNTRERYLPLGQLTRTEFDRHAQPIFILNADGSTLTWVRDYFGHELQHKNLSGEVIHHDYNLMGQVRRQYSEQNLPRTYMQVRTEFSPKNDSPHYLVKHVPSVPFPPVPPQDIYYEYQFGILADTDDRSLQRVTFFDYDSESRCVTRKIVKPITGDLFHLMTTDYDAYSRPIKVYNKRMAPTAYHDETTITTRYDAVSNRRSVAITLSPSCYVPQCGIDISQHQMHWYSYDAVDRVLVHDGRIINGELMLAPGHGVTFDYQDGHRRSEQYRDSHGAYVSSILEYNDDGVLLSTAAGTGLNSERHYHVNGWMDTYRENYFGTHTERSVTFNPNGWQLTDISKENDKTISETTYDDFSEAGMSRHHLVDYHDEYNTKDNYSVSYRGYDTWVQESVTGVRGNKYGSGQSATSRFYFDPYAAINAKENSADEAYYADWMGPDHPIYYENTHDGWVLNKQWIVGGVCDFEWLNRQYQYIYDVRGTVYGGYAIQSNCEQSMCHKTHDRGHAPTNWKPRGIPVPLPVPDENIQGFAVTEESPNEIVLSEDVKNGFLIPDTFVHPSFEPPREKNEPLDGTDVVIAGPRCGEPVMLPPGAAYPPAISAFVLRDFVGSVGRLYLTDKNAKVNSLGWNDIPPPAMGPLFYLVKSGESLEIIAKNEGGDEAFARGIAEVNGLPSVNFPIRPGTILLIPQFIGMHNKAENARPYQEFMSIMIGSLSPRLMTPQPKPKRHHTNWFSVIAKIIAVMVVIALAPGLAGFVLQAAGVTTGLAAIGGAAATGALTGVDILMTGVMAGLADAAVQGVAIGLGAQARFSFSEVLETGVSAAMPFLTTEVKDIATAGKAALEAGTAAAATQLAEMAAGIRSKFDLSAVAMQTSAVLVNTYVVKGVNSQLGEEGAAAYVAREVSVSAADSLLGQGITHTPVDIRNIASNAIGSMVGSEVGGRLAVPQNAPTPAELRYAKDVVDGRASLSDPSLDKFIGQRPAVSDAGMYPALPAGVKSRAPSKHSASAKPTAAHEEVKAHVSQSRDSLWKSSAHASDHAIKSSQLGKNPRVAGHASSHTDYVGLAESALIGVGAVLLIPEEITVAVLAGAGYLALETASALAPETAMMAGMMGDVAASGIAAVPFVGGKALKAAGMFGRGGKGAESQRLVSGMKRVSSDAANKPFLSEKALAEGWKPPYPEDSILREITVASEAKFYRVHTDPDKAVGRFLAREKEIAPYLDNPEALRLHLGLPEVPIYITEVNVPLGANLLAGRIGSQPNFGLMTRSGFQYQLTSKIPESSFTNTRQILEPKLYPDMSL